MGRRKKEILWGLQVTEVRVPTRQGGRAGVTFYDLQVDCRKQLNLKKILRTLRTAAETLPEFSEHGVTFRRLQNSFDFHRLSCV